MSKLPVHQPGVYNIDRAVNDGWTCVGNRLEKQDALAIAGKQAALTGARHRVCTPGGKVIFDSEQAMTVAVTAESPAAADASAKAKGVSTKQVDASQFVDRYGRRVLTDKGAPGMDGVEGVGSSTECLRNKVAAAIFANCSQLDSSQLDEIIHWLDLYRGAHLQN